MAVRLVVFDIAGTTVVDKGYVANAFQQAFHNNGYSIRLEDTHPYMGVKKIYAVKMMLDQLGVEFSTTDAEKIHSDFESAMIDFYERDPAVMPFPDTEEVFEFLKEKGILIALNTGFPKSIAEVILNRFQWLEKRLVDQFIASDEVKEGRPSSAMIIELMKRCGISESEEVVKVGDTIVDIEEGLNAGCKYIIAVTTGSGTKEEFSNYSPIQVIHSLCEIQNLLSL